tara:strand:- start:26945 stop:27517 length:573 start_codon:yes stop_codon:yes gene_type:complete
MKDTAQLLSQFEKYQDVLKKVIGSEPAKDLCETLGERLLMCPRGLTEEDGGSPGELLAFSLEVASIAKSLSKTYGNTKSLVKVALLHELGRIGGLDANEDLYVVQESEWHRDKLGQVYKYNDGCPKMNISHRTLWLLSHFGIELSREEWVAINISQGMHLPENQFYGNSLNSIAAGLLSARLSVLHGNNT